MTLDEEYRQSLYGPTKPPTILTPDGIYVLQEDGNYKLEGEENGDSKA